MVRGLELFANWFAPHSKQYVLIGGTACSFLLEEVGLEFRATKDLNPFLKKLKTSPLDLKKSGLPETPLKKNFKNPKTLYGIP